MDGKTPRWSGKLLDANGRTGTIEVDTSGEGEAGRGRWHVRLAERGGAQVEFKGEVTFREEDGRVVLQSNEQEGRGVRWEARLEREKAGRYAQAAMLGEYRSEGGPEAPLSRGVMVLWQFA